jgi:membrane associated rhomboid family serine protease
VAFALELPGGSENDRNLVSLGALLLPHRGNTLDLLWRFLASGFLHFGPVHLGLNVLCLWIIGRVLEREYGYRLLLTSFLTGSVGAFALAYLYWTAPTMSDTVLVGGSAGIFGLVGALGTFSLVGYLVFRARIFQQRLTMVVVIVAAQLLFDWFTPITSSFLHLAGLGAGALVSLPWALRKLRRGKRRAPGTAAS